MIIRTIEEDNDDRQKVICDSCVWYWIADGKFLPSDEVRLVPTYFSLAEIASSPMMVDIVYYQKVVRAIYDHCGGIIALDPFDFILENQLDDYHHGDGKRVQEILKGFTRVLKMDLTESPDIDEKFKAEVRKKCDESRQSLQGFADFGNEELKKIRKSINLMEGKNEHLKKEGLTGATWMLTSFLDMYSEKVGYDLDATKLDGGQTDLFLCTTESYFKKLETTKNMKIDANDIVDWFNLMYVRPGNLYLTFDGKWRKRILTDERVKNYLYHPDFHK